MRNNKSIRSGLKEKIISLGKRGLSYRQIEKKLGCSKGLISYHLGEGQKEKSYKRMMKLRDKGIRYEPNRWQYIEKVEKLKEVA